MQIDIISDVVCPWCYVAKRQLEHALAQRPGLQVQIRWFPYQLHPEAPAEGYPYRETIERKYGRQMIEMMFGRITAAGAAVGLELHLDRIARGANTLDAHRLIEWARAEDREDPVPGRLPRRPRCRRPRHPGGHRWRGGPGRHRDRRPPGGFRGPRGSARPHSLFP